MSDTPIPGAPKPWTSGEQLTARKLNESVDAISKLVGGVGVPRQVATEPTLIRGELMQMQIVSIENDYLTCYPYNGTEALTTQIAYVAKPYLLRRTPFDGETRNEITYTYVTSSERTASKSGEDDITEKLTPSYQVGDVIYVAKNTRYGTSLTVNDVAINLIDANLDGRCWAQAVDVLTPSVPTHSDSHKDGGADEVGTSVPGAAKIPKADASGKLDSWVTDASTSAKGKVQLAASGGTTAGTAVQASDTRLSDARTPTAHAHVVADIGAEASTDGQVPTSDGAGNVAWEDPTGAGGLTWVAKTAAYTAVANDGILADTLTTGAWSLQLPASPSNGDTVGVLDSKSNFATANLTITRNGSLIEGLAEDLTCAMDDASFDLVYSGATLGWVIKNKFPVGNPAEPALGNPATTGFVLSSTDAGVRSWVAQSSGTVDRSINQFRLTLESGVPVSTTDQTAKTTVYACPAAGGAATQAQISLLGTDDTTWATHSTAQLSIGTTTTRNGTTTNGNKVISGLATTVDLVVGQEITGTGVGAGSVIATIDSATQVTGTVNSTASATVSVTFKCPASKNYDLFVVDISSTPTLVFGPVWTNDTTRATAITQKDGVPVLSGAFVVGGTSYAEGRLRHVGAVRTISTAGQTEDRFTVRYIWSRDNQVRRKGYATNSTASWTYATAAWRESNNGTGAIRCNFLVGAPTNIEIVPAFNAVANAGITGYAAVMIDGTTSAITQWVFLSTGIVQTYGTRNYEVAAGLHYATITEYVSGSLVTYYCSGSATSPGYGSEVFFQC